MEAQRTQTEVISSLHERKAFHAIEQIYVRHTDKNTHRKHIHHAKKRCKYCRHEHELRWCLVHGKRCDKFGQPNHFTDVCRSARSNVVNTIEKEPVHAQEPGIETVNINSVIFYSDHSTLITNLKKLSNKATIMEPHKVDTGCDGNKCHLIYSLNYSLAQQRINWQQQKMQLSIKLHSNYTIR